MAYQPNTAKLHAELQELRKPIFKLTVEADGVVAAAFEADAVIAALSSGARVATARPAIAIREEDVVGGTPPPKALAAAAALKKIQMKLGAKEELRKEKKLNDSLEMIYFFKSIQDGWVIQMSQEMMGNLRAYGPFNSTNFINDSTQLRINNCRGKTESIRQMSRTVSPAQKEVFNLVSEFVLECYRLYKEYLKASLALMTKYDLYDMSGFVEQVALWKRAQTPLAYTHHGDRTYIGSNEGLTLDHQNGAIIMTMNGQEVIKNELTEGHVSFGRAFWGGYKTASQLPLAEASPEQLVEAKKRGERYLELAYSAKMFNITKQCMIQTLQGMVMVNTFGRAVVDQLSSDMSGISGKRLAFLNKGSTKSVGREAMLETDEHAMAYFPHHLNGYTLARQRWVAIFLDGMEEVKFRENPFERLVMNEKVKQDIFKVATNFNRTQGVDFVDGKAGGAIFLLKGEPGVGKTLTAEVVSEQKRLPLLRVNVGRLGTEPSEVESNLKVYLELAERWGAILLLDEADIFLEARDSENVVRNAIVCIFLTLLEYYSGILFLTTNRGANLDKAVISRVLYNISVPNLTPASRSAVLCGLQDEYAGRFQFTESALAELSSLNLNGRELKNFMRVADLTSELEEPVTGEYVLECIRAQREDLFTEQVAEAKSGARPPRLGFN